MATTFPLRRRPLVLADLVPGELVRDIALVLGAAGLIGALAQISFHLPDTPVPVTAQTLGVLVAGCGLGAKRGVLASVLYVCLGFVGLPWFASHSSGWQGASTGYLFGFVVATAVCGKLAERGRDRTVLSAVPTMLLGEVCIFAVGLIWLAIDLHVGAAEAFDLGLRPFIAGEVLKLAAAAGLLPATWRLAGRGARR